jgi:hypothetical protein
MKIAFLEEANISVARLIFQIQPLLHCRVVLAAVLGVLFSSCSLFFPSVTPENIQTLRTICSELPVPNFFNKIRERSLEKPELVIYSAEYSSSESPGQVEAAFESSLKPKGWSLTVTQEIGQRNLDFKRGEYSIHIEYLTPSLTSARKYLVDCGYNVPGK